MTDPSGTPASRPFWEDGYRDVAAPSLFGPPSEEIQWLVPRLPRPARVLDLGCGDGRNALHLLAHGIDVTAVDVSESAVSKLTAQATPYARRLTTKVQDIRLYRPAAPFDLIIAHGVLHLLPRLDWPTVIRRMQEHTTPSGYNAVTVFTDALPPPHDLLPFAQGLFREGELFDHYLHWRTELRRSYVKEDQHPGGERHRHPVNKIVARKPGPSR